MSKSCLDSDITVRRMSDGTRYVFPKRDLGKVRGLGVFLLLFGAFVTAFMCFWMYGPISEFFSTQNGMRWFMLVFGLLGTPGLLAGLGLLLAGISILMNMTHAEILITRDKLYSYEYMGVFYLRFKRSLSDIGEIVVSNEAIKATSNGKVSYPLGEDSSFMRLQGENMKSLFVLLGYPKELIRNFADFLSTEVVAGKPGLFSEKESIVVREETADEEFDDVVERPAGAISIYSEIEQGCTFTVPPVGLWKGSRGLFFFSLLWDGFMVFFTVVMLRQESGKIPAPVFAFIGFFWLIGAGLMLGAINMGRRRSLIAVVGNVLGIRRTGIFGTKETKIVIEDISDIRVGPSGMEVNDVPIMELQVFSGTLKRGKLGLLSQLDESEIEWIAYMLREKTGIKKQRS